MPSTASSRVWRLRYPSDKELIISTVLQVFFSLPLVLAHRPVDANFLLRLQPAPFVVTAWQGV